jgi:hypothetical protein
MWADMTGPNRLKSRMKGDVQKARMRQRAACQGGQPWLRHALPPANLLDIMPPVLNRSEHPQVSREAG